jgi:hypothetical protein
MGESKRLKQSLKPGAFAQKPTGPHPWRRRSATREKAEQQALNELVEVERTHERVTGGGGCKEAGAIRKRRLKSTA